MITIVAPVSQLKQNILLAFYISSTTSLPRSQNFSTWNIYMGANTILFLLKDICKHVVKIFALRYLVSCSNTFTPKKTNVNHITASCITESHEEYKSNTSKKPLFLKSVSWNQGDSGVLLFLNTPWWYCWRCAEGAQACSHSIKQIHNHMYSKPHI